MNQPVFRRPQTTGSFVLVLVISMLAVPIYAKEDQTLIGELKTLSDKARQERAADRWLQQELDNLIARYDAPALNVLVFQNFQDRRFSPADNWQFSGGRTEIDRGYALVSRVDRNATTGSGEAEASSTERKVSREEAVAGLLVGLLMKDQRSEPDEPNAPAEAAPEPGEHAVAILPVRITNAFLVELEMTLKETSEEARIEYGVFQSPAEKYGYSLKIKTGKRGYIEIERRRGERSSIVDSQDLPDAFSDSESHQLAWLQDKSGRILVTMDDKIVLDTSDKAFKDDYQQLNIVNRSGELAIHSLKISG